MSNVIRRGVNYIPPVDNKPMATYAGCYRVSPAPTLWDDMMRTNPACPCSLCPPNAGPTCSCNKHSPWLHRYFVYGPIKGPKYPGV